MSALEARIREYGSEPCIIFLICVGHPYKLPSAIWTSYIVLDSLWVTMGAVVCGLDSNSTEADLLLKCELNPAFTIHTIYSAPLTPIGVATFRQIFWEFFMSAATTLDRVLTFNSRLVLIQTIDY